MMWAIYSKDSDMAIWVGENSKDLVKTMGELNKALGDRFYLNVYERSSSEATNK